MKAVQSFGVALIVTLLLLAPTSPVQSVEAGDKTGMDPKALETIGRFGDYVAHVKNFRVKAAMDWRVTGGAGHDDTTSKYVIAMERPNRFALIQRGGDVGASVVSNGEQLFTYIPHREAYALEDAPSDFDRINDALTMAERVTNMTGFALVRALLSDDPAGVLTAGFETGEYLGTAKVGGHTCDHVKLTRDELTFEFWIRTGKKPELMRFVMGLPEDQARIGDLPVDTRGGKKMQVRVTLSGWKLDGKMRDKHFKYKVPKKAREIDETLKLADAYPPHPLLGKKAPKLKLDLVDGGKFQLAKHKNEHVVVLDFWATWCPPCRLALPGLIEVTDAYRDQGVIFIAVNQGETKADVERFFKQQKLDFTVALDPRGKAAQKYHVQGLPQTVIIAKDGTVQAIHQGFSPDLKDRLKDELQALLAGEQLADAGH